MVVDGARHAEASWPRSSLEWSVFTKRRGLYEGTNVHKKGICLREPAYRGAGLRDRDDKRKGSV